MLALIAAAAGVTTFVACASTGSGEGGSISAALAEIKDLVDSTVAEVAEGQKVEPDPFGDTGCHDALGAPADTVTRDYGVKIEFDRDVDLDAVLQDVFDHWESREANPSFQNLESEFPVVRGDRNDNIFEFFVNRKERFASLGGSTPCMEPDE